MIKLEIKIVVLTVFIFYTLKILQTADDIIISPDLKTERGFRISFQNREFLFEYIMDKKKTIEFTYILLVYTQNVS